MPRKDALLRLQTTLHKRREDLRKLLAGELAYLHDFKAADSFGDSADLAFEAGSDEMSSRLAELNARELIQVERVLAQLKKGTYGVCEGGSDYCQRRIPMARLNALPYALFCINCERQQEKLLYTGQDAHHRDNWAQLATFQAPKDDQRTNVTQLELNLSRSQPRYGILDQ
jgi:DnaK suppressor protein